MKSKAHYKKCVELKIVPVPTSVCDENIDKDALGRLTLAGGYIDDTTSSDEESEFDGESDESDNEETDAVRGLLRLARPTNQGLPGLLPSTRPATYPYSFNLLSADGSTLVPMTNYAINQGSLSSRHCMTGGTEKSQLNVIRPNRPNESYSGAPMILTAGQTEFSGWNIDSGNILVNVSSPALLESIVQTMERLPIEDREWSTETSRAKMLRTYLTESYMLNSKMKQQYHVIGNESTGLENSGQESELPILASVAEKISFVTKLSDQSQGSSGEMRRFCTYNEPIHTMNDAVNTPQEDSLTGQKIIKQTYLELKQPSEIIVESLEQESLARKVVVSGPGFISLSPQTKCMTTFISECSRFSRTKTSTYVK